MALGWLWWRAWARLVAGDAAQVCAGVALGDIDFGFAWQAWHLATSTFVLRGRPGSYGPGLVARLGAGVALGDIHLRFAWQAWHLVTSTFVLRGRRGMAWHFWLRAGSGGTLGRAWSPVTPLNFAWQAWRLAGSTLVLRGRRGTCRHPPSFRVAGVALMALGWLWWRAWSLVTPLKFAWQARHLVASTLVLRGRCGAWRHPPSFCVACVALGHIHLRFVAAVLSQTFIRLRHRFLTHTTFTRLCRDFALLVS